MCLKTLNVCIYFLAVNDFYKHREPHKSESLPYMCLKGILHVLQ